jgi:hypothetical protein
MKTIPSLISALTTLALAILPASASSYGDATGDFTAGSWGDMTSVNVNNDATTLTFKINTAGSPDLVANTWHQYYIGISEGLFGGVGGNLSTSSYGRNIQMGVGGLDFALLSYPAFSGYDRFTWNGASWVSGSGAGLASWDPSGVTINVSLAALGLSAGNTLTFDVWTSDSGSDTVLDALSDVTPRGFNANPFNTGAGALSYTVSAVPEPATCTLMVLGALVMIRRVFSRNAK